MLWYFTYYYENIQITNKHKHSLRVSIAVEAIKKQWKGMRDRLRKAVMNYEKATRSGAGATADPKWKWYLYMKWLSPHLARPRSHLRWCGQLVKYLKLAQFNF